jgi:hypothetical protein
MNPYADRWSERCWTNPDRRDQSEGVKAQRRFSGLTEGSQREMSSLRAVKDGQVLLRPIRCNYRCCGAAVAAVFNARLSTVILACGAYISSQLCSDQ